MVEPSELPPSIVRDAFSIARRSLTEPEIRALRDFGQLARTTLEPTAQEIDRRDRPHLSNDPTPRVVLAAAHERALDALFATGLGAVGANGSRDWPLGFAFLHELADVGLLCSATVTLAATFAIEKWADPELAARVLPPLRVGGGRAMGATWATEEQGGSDLGANRAWAEPDARGRWRLTGEKFFCSNVGASGAVVTARPKESPAGIRGLRLFYLPASRADGGPNWRVRRLKEKLGTITVPTGEVSFDAAEAYPLGDPASGLEPIMEMLNVSRVANAVGSAAVLQRALEWSLEYARRRFAFGRALADHPLMALDLATLAVESDSASLLAFDGAFRLARALREKPPYSDETHLLRLTAHVAKLVTAEQSVRGCGLAMEIYGGRGYLEEFPIAKLLRDALVTPIWEGGANLQALDAREVARRFQIDARWTAAARRAVDRTGSDEIREFFEDRLSTLETLREEVDAKRWARMWGEVRELTLLVARSLVSHSAPVYDARAQLYVRLHSPESADAMSASLVRTALGGSVSPAAPGGGPTPSAPRR